MEASCRQGFPKTRVTFCIYILFKYYSLRGYFSALYRVYTSYHINVNKQYTCISI